MEKVSIYMMLGPAAKWHINCLLFAVEVVCLEGKRYLKIYEADT